MSVGQAAASVKTRVPLALKSGFHRFPLRKVFFAYTVAMVPLESCKLFSELPATELDSLRKVAREMAFAPGQALFKEGDKGDGIYVVKGGLVQISATVGTGDPRVLSRLGPGDLFGEMAVLDNDPRSATATAEEPTVVYFIGRTELLDMLDKTPRLATGLVREISRRLRDFNQQYIREVIETERLALLGRFTSSIVHDLKNPLNIIGISADMACQPTSTAESRQVSKMRIRKQVERISNMLSELLEFARGSQTPFVLARIDYGKFVEQLIEEIHPEISLKSVVIEFENEPPSVPVQINPQRLTRLFHNLIHNAADAMPSGGRVKLRFNVQGQEILTELQDTGKGIAPQIADRLFEAFATYGKANGTGLGLSISKKIVQDHNGRIFARNAPVGGAIFGFTLPVQPD
jgi:signal transduction histidine kinase